MNIYDYTEISNRIAGLHETKEGAIQAGPKAIARKYIDVEEGRVVRNFIPKSCHSGKEHSTENGISSCVGCVGGDDDPT